jgi:hypothetical protein
VNSVSIFMWWVSGLLLHPLSLVVVIVEGWRVRLPLFQTVVYAILANGYTQIVALPLFFIEWRNYVRINDCIWNLDMEDPKSPVRIEAEKDGLKSLSNLTPRRKNKPTAPLAPLSLSRAPTISANTGTTPPARSRRTDARPRRPRRCAAASLADPCRRTPRCYPRSQPTPRAAALAVATAAQRPQPRASPARLPRARSPPPITTPPQSRTLPTRTTSPWWRTPR